jgi:hypothetical protein
MSRKSGSFLESRKELRLGVSKKIRILLFLLLGAVSLPAAAQRSLLPARLDFVPLDEPDGQILSYRYQAGATEVRLQGTRQAPRARIRLKIGSRPGFVELDINRGLISGLEPAQHFGKDFLTYVLWAVSVDGRASNLGEITFNGQNPVSINVTTPYQTFWLMVTAEPDYAVADPSNVVVLYSVDQNGADAPPEKRAQRIEGKLSYYTHYNSYDFSQSDPGPGPNELLQARKALELANKAGVPSEARSGLAALNDDQRISAALALARDFLKQAETAYNKDPKGSDVVQFSRTAAQIAENARALSLGAVGDVAVRRLENEVKALQSELKAREAGKAKPIATPAAEATPVAVLPVVAAPPAIPEPIKPPEEVKTNASGIAGTVMKLAAQPITWFGVIGWVVVILLLFRRPSV